tara:strand:- start:1566 stop:1736 length:171 start_codon:yes stop_codon:yes gene_type:complete
MMDLITWWISLLTIFFIMESALLLYFVRWILWRWNGSIQELLIAHYSNSESTHEEE